MADDIGNEPSFIETTIVPDDGYDGIIECDDTTHPCNRYDRAAYDMDTLSLHIPVTLDVSNTKRRRRARTHFQHDRTHRRFLFDRGRQCHNRQSRNLDSDKDATISMSSELWQQ